MDVTGTQLAVLYGQVSLIQRWICTQLYVVQTENSVLIIEVFCIESVPYREVQLHSLTLCTCPIHMFA